jgi:hypothetical protein
MSLINSDWCPALNPPHRDRHCRGRLNLHLHPRRSTVRQARSILPTSHCWAMSSRLSTTSLHQHLYRYHLPYYLRYYDQYHFRIHLRVAMIIVPGRRSQHQHLVIERHLQLEHLLRMIDQDEVCMAADLDLDVDQCQYRIRTQSSTFVKAIVRIMIMGTSPTCTRRATLDGDINNTPININLFSSSRCNATLTMFCFRFHVAFMMHSFFLFVGHSYSLL